MAPKNDCLRVGACVAAAVKHEKAIPSNSGKAGQLPILHHLVYCCNAPNHFDNVVYGLPTRMDLVFPMHLHQLGASRKIVANRHRPSKKTPKCQRRQQNERRTFESVRTQPSPFGCDSSRSCKISVTWRLCWAWHTTNQNQIVRMKARASLREDGLGHGPEQHR